MRAVLGDVDTRWAPSEGPLSATLLFGVGAQDLTLDTAGLRHLAEHVVMSRIGHPAQLTNARSGRDVVGFEVTGYPGRGDGLPASSVRGADRLRTGGTP